MLKYTVREPKAEWHTALVLMTFDDEKVPELSEAECRAALITVSGFDWNRDLTPWPAPRVFRGGEDFGGMAPKLLQELTGTLLPAAEAALSHLPEKRCIIGVSLAGLFAMWSAFSCEAFDGAASVSGSFWYPGAMDFFKEHRENRPLSAYLSLGDREEKTRNPIMAMVGQNTRELAAMLNVPLVMHPGGHFQDGEMRLMRAMQGMVNASAGKA